MTTLHDFQARTLEGEERPLSDYAGKVALIVNVASKCGLTPHYEGLEKLHRSLGERGLVVLGFPCNQFGAQEPGTPEEIRSFCATTYDVSFPLFAKIDVNGESRDPLYAWLTSQATAPDGPGDIKWNFAKFVVGRDGNVVARFAPTVTPTSEELVAAVEAALG
ncbi:MAG: glutathione peroxidase [Sandaracinus sp.]|nr:glutathione peroxidase [Sandaracinus sp.]MCB9624934.1 glutathione peroxidase [Sandaracinus sp.]